MIDWEELKRIEQGKHDISATMVFANLLVWGAVIAAIVWWLRK